MNALTPQRRQNPAQTQVPKYGSTADMMQEKAGNNIILTGFMGTGKTTVGKMLAQQLDREFIDTDELIQQRTGQSIPDIFRTQGEAAFRQMEADIARELSARQGLVIATGGRLMLDPANIASLTRTGCVFCLIATPQEILSRIEQDNEHRRPLLEVPQPGDQIVALLKERQKGYHRFLKVVTTGKKPEEVTENLLGIFRDKPKQFSIDHPVQPYGYVVGSGILPFVRQLAGVSGPIVVITDPSVADLYAQSCRDVDHVIVLPTDNQQKTLATVQTIYQKLIGIGFDRRGTIVALGGSVVGDIAGFVAATYMRGVNLIQCPTSLLAMADTSIGGKTSLDLPQGNNVIGLYKQPVMVIADVATLQTLPREEFKSGMAEIIKYGLIADSNLLTTVQTGNWRHETGVLYTSLFDVQNLVTQSIQVKSAIVQEDPFDQGRRFCLNFGHTFAHAIEEVSGHAVRHGEAVAMGMIAATNLSVKTGRCAPDLQAAIETILQKVGLPTRIPHLSPDSLIKSIRNEEKRRGERLRIVLLNRIGQTSIADDIPKSVIKSTLMDLMQP